MPFLNSTRGVFGIQQGLQGRARLGTIDNPASSATQLQQNGINTDGYYYILFSGVSRREYVNFSFNGGPYILIMKFSNNSSYSYASSVWTDTTGGLNVAIDPTSNTDQVSSLFYTYSSTRTGLAMFQNSTSYFHFIDTSNLTARNLANGAGGALTATVPNGGQISANNLITNGQAQRAQGWFNAISAAGTSISNGATYYRHGWRHRDPPDPSQFGYVRFGWSADLDGSDSQDRGIGVGIQNLGGGPVGSFTAGSGAFDYNDGTTGRTSRVESWLYVGN